MVAVKGRSDRKRMLATHITPFPPIARDGHAETETVTSSYKTAAKSRSTGTIRARIAVSGVAVGLDRRRATQVAAIIKTKLTPIFISWRHVPRAEMKPGRTPNVNENSAEEIASPP